MSDRCATRFALLGVLALLPLITPADSAPLLINFQGRLTDSGGVPVTTAQTVRVTLIQGGTESEPTSQGATIYQEDALVTPEADGVFVHVIGEGTPVGGQILEPADFDTADPVFVELSIGSETLLPRTRLVSTAYALEASRLEGKSADQLVAQGGGLAPVRRRARNGALLEFISGTQMKIGPGVLGFPDDRARKNRSAITWDAANGVGLLGLDAGTLTVDTFYYLYAVPDPTDEARFSAVASTAEPVAVGGAGPSGHAVHRFLGSFRTDGASAVLRFHRSGPDVYFQGRIGDWLNVVGAQPSTNTWVFIDASGFMPRTSRAVMINGYYDEGNSSAAYTFYVAPESNHPSTRICTDFYNGASGCDATVPTVDRSFYYYAELPTWASSSTAQTTEFSYRGYQEDLREF